MFILHGHGRDVGGKYQYVIGYSKDKAKLQAMIDQFHSATSEGGVFKPFKQCPETIKFGKFTLKKSTSLNRYFAKKFDISHTDFLSIKKIKEL